MSLLERMTAVLDRSKSVKDSDSITLQGDDFVSLVTDSKTDDAGMVRSLRFIQPKNRQPVTISMGAFRVMVAKLGGPSFVPDVQETQADA